VVVAENRVVILCALTAILQSKHKGLGLIDKDGSDQKTFIRSVVGTVDRPKTAGRGRHKFAHLTRMSSVLLATLKNHSTGMLAKSVIARRQ
jgi:hypothetical protein